MASDSPGLVLRIGAAMHYARQVDAGDARHAAHDATLAGDRQRVFIVEAGICHPYHYFAGAEVR
jgi:hypothetical protein